MNKKELIKRLKDLPFSYLWDGPYLNKETVLELVKHLDEPEKVTVSEEEAKFLKTFDFNFGSDVTTALYRVSRVGRGYYLKDNDGIELKDLSEEFFELENRIRLIRAILDGYEVETEKRFRVKVKGICGNHETLNCEKHSKKWLFSDWEENSLYKTEHTRKELEGAGFGWVFDCEGIEIEEVEE